MKNTGIIRKVDELGRIVIPKEIRKFLEIEEGTNMEIYVKKDEIIIRKHKDTFCPLCLKRCNHEDKFCSNCGFEFDLQNLRKKQ